MSARAISLTIALVVVSAAHADETVHQKIQDLDHRQKQILEELRDLRESLATPAPGSERVGEIERRQGILTDELRRLRDALVLPETKQLRGSYGLGPAASKVYGLERGLSIGGYGEANFRSVVSDRNGTRDEFDFLRLILYVGYKFNDWILFNSEVEFEHASTGSTVSSGEGEVSVEFAHLDFLLHPMANVRAGMVLVPMGFINEIHEPPFYHGNLRPQVEQQILPSTWRANGFGLFGELLPGLEYRTYGITSMNAKGFSASGVRGGRQNGNRERADDWSWVGRLDYTTAPGVLLGGSAYLGDQGQHQSFGNVDDGFTEPGVFTQIYELHAQLRHRGLELRALGAVIDVSDTEILNRDPGVNPGAIDPAKKDQLVADVMLGYYAEVAYDVMPLFASTTTQYLAPWFRYSRFDTQNSRSSGYRADNPQSAGLNDREVYEIGLSYKPIPEVVLKADCRIQDAETGALPDEIRIGGGFAF